MKKYILMTLDFAGYMIIALLLQHYSKFNVPDWRGFAFCFLVLIYGYINYLIGKNKRS